MATNCGEGPRSSEDHIWVACRDQRFSAHCMAEGCRQIANNAAEALEFPLQFCAPPSRLKEAFAQKHFLS